MRTKKTKHPPRPADWPADPEKAVCSGLRGTARYARENEWHVCPYCFREVEPMVLIMRFRTPSSELFGCSPKCLQVAINQYDDLVRSRKPITPQDIAKMF